MPNQQLRIAIVTWMEPTHRRRRQAALGHLTPMECEMIAPAVAVQAAQLELSPIPAAVPSDLLPRDWPAAAARALFTDAYDALGEQATRRFRLLVGIDDPTVAALAHHHTSAEALRGL